jgi:hypothetical protein
VSLRGSVMGLILVLVQEPWILATNMRPGDDIPLSWQ